MSDPANARGKVYISVHICVVVRVGDGATSIGQHVPCTTAIGAVATCVFASSDYIPSW